MSVRVLCYKPSCNNFLHLTTVLKCATTKIFLQCLKNYSLLATTFPYTSTVTVSLGFLVKKWYAMLTLFSPNFIIFIWLMELMSGAGTGTGTLKGITNISDATKSWTLKVPLLSSFFHRSVQTASPTEESEKLPHRHGWLKKMLFFMY